MRTRQKKILNKITFYAGIAVMILVFGGVGYLIIYDDPIRETVYDTGDPNTSLIVREHLKTGQKDYIYGVVDGVGSLNP